MLARRSIEVATENRQTFEQLVRLNLARFQEGAIAEADLIKVRLERIKFDSAVKQAELSLRRAMIRLAENLEDPEVTKQNVALEMDLPLIDPDLESLHQIALRTRPDVQAAEREIDASKERLALEQARSHPDLTPFVGYKRLAQDNTLTVGISMPRRRMTISSSTPAIAVRAAISVIGGMVATPSLMKVYDPPHRIASKSSSASSKAIF